jgi:hypothetical protein
MGYFFMKRKTALEMDYPEWHEFLQWHNEVIKRYSGPVRMELRKSARDFVSRALVGEKPKRTF